MKQDIKKLIVKSRLINTKTKDEIRVKIDIIQFIEDSICYVYCPALDLTGYGLNEAEARQSFETTLAEYIKYTTAKKTFKKDLNVLGWKKIGKETYSAPTLTQLITTNNDLRELLDNVAYQKMSRNISLPAVA